MLVSENPSYQSTPGRESLTLWELEKQLNIPVWNNLLSLPELGRAHTATEIRLEQKIHFTFVQSEDCDHEEAQIFLSEQSNFTQLCKYLPFLFNKYKLFLCNHQLILERLSLFSSGNSFKADNSVTKQLYSILEEASKLNSSDIHIEPRLDKNIIRFRVDGDLQLFNSKEPIDNHLFVTLKLHAGMDIAQKRCAQDGHFHFITPDSKRFDLRVSTVPGIYGEKIVIRMLPAEVVGFSLNDIGISMDFEAMIRKSIASKSGMVLITGPTGSGKTTSLYAILNELKSETNNIITVEDPVEYRMDDITQVEVNELAGVSFSSALRSFLRQDPDVILVGEIRDQETAQIAARAAQTGHLVLSTLHCNSVFEAIGRLRNLGVLPNDIASSLSLIISQRLLPQLCECKNSDSECPKCKGKGVAGRVPILEVYPVSSSMRKVIDQNGNMDEIFSLAREEGFITIRQYGEQLVGENIISIRELEINCPL